MSLCTWTTVEECFRARPGFQDYLPSHNTTILPTRDDRIFRALNAVGSPGKVRIVILGQDPYPRPKSAVGLSFLDGAISSFGDPGLAPSIKNIMKSICITEGLMKRTDNIEKMRTCWLQRVRLSQEEWFLALANHCGVLWLNTSLTFSGKDAPSLRRHVLFWRPVMEKIFAEIIQHRGDGVVFVLWGDKAKKNKEFLLEFARKSNNSHVEFVEAKHPAFQPFFDHLPFSDIKACEQRLRMGITNFMAAEIQKDEPASMPPSP